jgi:hypothetical protein
VYRSLVGKPEEKTHLESLGTDGKIIFKWVFKKIGWTGLMWVAHERNRWQTLVNIVMKY